jgi:uncharacterized protein (UPF0254 family)
MNFLNPVSALKNGNSLENASFWKLMQSVMNIGAILMPTISAFSPELELTQPQVEGLLSSLAVANTYFTAATSEKVGF